MMYTKIFCFALCVAVALESGAQPPDSAIIKMMPDIPAGITAPQQRAAYLATRFWDKFDFKNADAMRKDNLLERCFADYLEVLSLTSDGDKTTAVQTLMQKAETAGLTDYILLLAERYLYETASPMRDEEQLIPFLEYALQSPALDDAKKIRPAFLHRNVMQNRTGRTANNFAYALVDGTKGTLYDIQADYTLLYFNDPDCEDCAALSRKLIVSPAVNDLIRQGKLRIAAIYLNDDLEAWKAKAASVLHSWIYARDAEQKIMAEGIYDVKHTPSLYLLDKDKKVLLKDVSFDALEEWLRNREKEGK